MKTASLVTAIAVIFWGMISPLSWGATSWATGSALQKRLNESVDVVWGEIPLRRALEGLAGNKNVAVLIDRRVDPSQKIDISLNQTPLKDVLEAIAQKYGLGVSMVGPVAYFAPPEAARRVRASVALRQEDLRRLSPAVAEKFLRRKPMAWDDLAAPRELLEKLGVESGVEIAGLDRVPHDLWAAADLPPLGLIERLTLIAGQFDLTFEISADGNRITLLPVPEHIEDHERIPAPRRPAQLNPEKSSDTDFTLKRYTLQVVEKPIGPLLKQLAAQLKLEIKMDDKAIEQAGVSLDQRVTFSVKDATVDELLQAALQKTQLKFIRRNNVVDIEPSQKN